VKLSSFRIFLAFFILHAGNLAMAIEEPNYKVIEKSEPYEIRQYPSMIVAETFVDGDMSSASSQGFRRIAGYIFGKNLKLKNGQVPSLTLSEKSGPEDSGEKIAMTIPVTVEPQETTHPDFDRSKLWRVQFVMPAQYTLLTLPKPMDTRVHLREVPERRYAVLTYTGLNWESQVKEKAQQLLDWMNTRHLSAIGTPQLARYNPPWSLPFLRRNEILVEIEGHHD